MSDIHSSINGRRGNSDDRHHDPLYQAQLQRLREENSGEEILENPASKIFHYAAANVSLKKLIDEFTGGHTLPLGFLNRQKAIDDIRAFKKVLEELAHFDKSHDPEFTNQLSLLWQNLYENCKGLDQTHFQSDILASQIFEFADVITHFPPGEDHTLGYYLSEHAGQDWIPFPFMNLLRSLHEEFQSDPSTSKLTQWLDSLASMINGREG